MDAATPIAEDIPATRKARAERSSLRDIVDNSDIRIGYLMAYMTNHYLGPVYKAVEARHGLTSPEFLCLFCINKAPGITAIDISRSTGRPRNSISRAIAQLLDKELMSIDLDANDRRRKLLLATERGKTLYVEVEHMFRKRHNRMLALISAEERALLEALLRRLAFRSDGWAAPY